MSPANGSTKQPLSTVVTLRGRRCPARERAGVGPAGGQQAEGHFGRCRRRVALDGQAFPWLDLRSTTRGEHGAGPARVPAPDGVDALQRQGSGTFTTAPPASIVTASVFPSPGIAVGVGQPIVFMFSQPVDTYAAQQGRRVPPLTSP